MKLPQLNLIILGVILLDWLTPWTKTSTVLTRLPTAAEDNIAYSYVLGTTDFCVKAAIILVVNVFNRIYISSMSNLS